MTTPDTENTARVPMREFRAPKPSAGPSRIACRVCGSGMMLSYLNLGKQPYANTLQPIGAPLAEGAELRLFACQRCQLSQLSHVAKRDTLYELYAYRSGVSAGWKKHCASLALEYGGLQKLTLDIASNDGTLVQAMSASGATAVGVEPSLSFGDCDYTRITGWWGAKLVTDQEMEGEFDVITAQNVLGHVHDVHDFMAGIALALAPNGVAIIEVPYVVDMLRALSFDTVYHEHLSYWSVTALRELCNAHKLTLSDIQPLALHGGSIRAIITKGDIVRANVASYLATERRDLNKSAYLRFSERVSARIHNLSRELVALGPYIGSAPPPKPPSCCIAWMCERIRKSYSTATTGSTGSRLRGRACQSGTRR